MITFEIVTVLTNTFLQSIVSTVFTIFFAILGAMGINSISANKYRSAFKTLCIVTTLLPALFLITATLNIIKPFPYGFYGVVLLHVLSMVAFCSVVVAEVFSAKLFVVEKLAYLEGASRTRLIWNAIGIVKADIYSLAVYVFVVFFASFSIPFLVAYDFPVFETYIFNILKTESNLIKALLASLIQMSIIYFLIYFSRKSLQSHKISSNESILFLKNKTLLIIPLVPMVIILGGLLKGVANGFMQFTQIGTPWDLVIKTSVKSMVLSLTTGVLFVFAFMYLTTKYHLKKLHEIIYALTIPSTALVGLLMWMLFDHAVSKDAQVIIGYFLLFFLPLYRLKFFDELQALSKQIDVAELMGASRKKIYRTIILPQILPTIIFLSSLGAFWALGDFALSQMIYGNDSTLALFIQTLATQYRLEAASLLLFILFFCGAIIYIFFRGLKYVFD